MNERRIFTVGELRGLIQDLPDDCEITFGGGLEFDRLAKRGDKHVELEFMQLVYLGPRGTWHTMPKPAVRYSNKRTAPSPVPRLARRQAARDARKPG